MFTFDLSRTLGQGHDGFGGSYYGNVVDFVVHLHHQLVNTDRQGCSRPRSDSAHSSVFKNTVFCDLLTGISFLCLYGRHFDGRDVDEMFWRVWPSDNGKSITFWNLSEFGIRYNFFPDTDRYDDILDIK